MGVILEIKSGAMAGKTIPITTGKSVTVGRAAGKSEFALAQDTFLSGLHFAVECGASGCRVIDKKSSNGTFLNGAKIQDAMLANGDEIKAGKTVFLVKIVSDEKIAALLPQRPAAPPVAPPEPPPARQAEPLPRIPEIDVPQHKEESVSPPRQLEEPPRPRAEQPLPKAGESGVEGNVPASAPPVEQTPPPRRREIPGPEKRPVERARVEIREPAAPSAEMRRPEQVADEAGSNRPASAPPRAPAESSRLPRASSRRDSAFSVGGWSFPPVPADWTVQEGFGLQRSAAEELPSSVSATEEVLAGITLQQFVESQLSMLRGYLRDPKIEPLVPPRVDGADESMGVDVRHKTKDGRELAYRHIYARSGSSVGILTVMTLASEFPKVMESLAPVLSGAAFRASVLTS